MTDDTILLRPAPPREASKSDHINWLMECACEFGKMVSVFARETGADDEQITLIFSYMYGRAHGCYIDIADDQGMQAVHAMFELGVEHGRRARNEDDFDERSNAEGTETRQ